ncbi:MAG: hypothetical protein A2600_03950 [Candidatus Lambdaproteobacteria bacterium RIFOXYD1_FULL_56_27]|uniref:Bacterial spore germination immunoglobulin-like domain-containing protein n=1 Tax=Candidatus Lambdaproteobacteria bacterium RIFOXYD2_FULL_56_26 TaxID=1817773 RepID=A0A1F6H3G6_9PROT|nr:MAG: hypothetical protein A2426_01750 [Candidatus Lambdaproteobacteria bacterium RIFOXYC1_FULL_56_13]OGH04911.1 MAG: hypothetical protein A2557_08015 [Candidatus Lambdaproteobacteria bacterium RIFOXYD2_FULL_56_26]OGH09375.1 MAG: hypothetical protein A2600_03950 [Candidatus Lambdaproteobacteria bacterium RIFOXYD1_FULL_56_27]
MTGFQKITLGLAVCLGLWGCKDSVSLKSIAVTPAGQVTTLYSSAIQYTATGSYSDNSAKDLTDSVVWSVDATGDNLFSTAVPGLLSPNRLGSFILLATFKASDPSSDVVGYTNLRITN